MLSFMRPTVVKAKDDLCLQKVPAEDNVDAFFKQALAAGGKELKPLMDQFYGNRSGQLEDPFGHLWWVATHKEDVGREEMKKRVQAMFAGEK